MKETEKVPSLGSEQDKIIEEVEERIRRVHIYERKEKTI